MSSGNQQHFTATDMDMLNRILERAAIGNLLDSTDPKARMKAARFLIEAFQKGITSESALYFALLSRPAELSEPSLANAGARSAGPRPAPRRQPESDYPESAIRTSQSR